MRQERESRDKDGRGEEGYLPASVAGQPTARSSGSGPPFEALVLAAGLG
jgi:hypothetical protein